GAQNSSGAFPNGIEAQVRQTLDNVQNVLRAEGLTLQHVVSAHVYLADIQGYEALNQVWSTYFPKDAPARTVVGVARMPLNTPVEISAVAVVDLRRKKVVQVRGRKDPDPVSPAISIGDRVFLTAGIGRDSQGSIPRSAHAQIKSVIDRAEQTLKGAGLDLRHMAFANVYVDPAMPMKELAEALDEFIPNETAKTIVQTASLPFGVHIEISGVASRGLKRIGGYCSTVSDTVYCSGRAGTVRQTLQSLKADLEANKLDLGNAVASTVFMDDLEQFAAMNKVYATFFSTLPPTRTTVQPWKKFAELSLPPTTGVSAKNDDSPRGSVTIVAVQ
ncbi:MAG: RidA family protein, partial [Bryobacteraceae bacterium]